MAVRRTKISAATEDDTQEDTTQEEPKSARRPAYSGGGGWGAPARRETVKAPFFTVKEPKIAKILSDMPDLYYLQHFMGPGKAPVMCYASGSANPKLEIAKERMAESKNAGHGDCPICTEAPGSASYGFMINVVDLTEDGEIVRKWTFGNQFKNLLESRTKEDRTSPLNRETDSEGRYRPLYFRIHQTKMNNAWTYAVDPLKSDELRDDYGIEPPTEAQVQEWQDEKYGEEAMFYWPLNKMIEFAPVVAEIQRKAQAERDRKAQ
jgi:hypothetical protein